MAKQDRKAYFKEYYQRNKQKVLEKHKERYATDKDYRERLLETATEWYMNNYEKAKEYSKNYMAKRKSQKAKANKEYWQKNGKDINKMRKKVREERNIVLDI